MLFDVYSKCADALTNGQVDAVTTDNVILTGLSAAAPTRFKLVGKPFTKEPYGIGLKKGDTAFRNFINDTLEESFNGRLLGRRPGTRTAGNDQRPGGPEPPAVDRY